MYIFVYIFVSYNLRSTKVKPTGFQTLTPSKFKGWYPPQGGRAFHFGKAWHDVAGSVRFNTNKTDTKIQPKISRRYPAVLHGSSIFADARALCDVFDDYDDDDEGEGEDDCEIMAEWQHMTNSWRCWWWRQGGMISQVGSGWDTNHIEYGLYRQNWVCSIGLPFTLWQRH